MDENQRYELEKEQAKGEEYERVWESYVQPFFDEKTAELFDAFCALPTTDEKALITIKMQQNTLEMIRDHFQHFMTTGTLARATLEKESENE